MHIYIDESGTFSNPQGQPVAESVVAAVVIPTEFHEAVLDGVAGLARGWGLGQREIKGKELSEGEVASVIRHLAQFPVVLDFRATDLAILTDQEITQHKTDQADRLLAHLTTEHKPSLVAEMESLSAELAGLSNQLYVQLVLAIQLVESLIRSVILFYVQRYPEELGSFAWRVDRKDTKETRYETLWKTLLPAFLQSRSIAEPFMEIEEYDYSAFSKYLGSAETMPSYLAAHSADPGGRFDYIDIKRILRDDFLLADSRESLGLQVADIIANTVRRGMAGRLRESGWGRLGSLTVVEAHGSSRYVALRTPSRQESSPVTNQRHRHFLGKIIRDSKPMLVS